MHEEPRNGHRANGHHRAAGMRSRPVRLPEEPVDLVAVQADDELINALAAGMPVSRAGYRGYSVDDHVAAILASWRSEVDEEPIPELVDIDTAVATVKAAARPRSRVRHLVPVAAAAAVVVMAMGGVSIGSASAEPGDALWGISKVLFTDRADSLEAAFRVEDRLDKAKQALAEGQSPVAAQELQEASADLAQVRPEEGQAQLADVQDFLTAKADETPPGVPTDPGMPLERDRARRVPEGAAIGKRPTQTATPPESATPDPTVAPSPTSGPPVTRDPRSLNAPGSPAAPATPTAPAAPSGASTATTAPASPSATTEGGPVATTPTPGQSMGTSRANPGHGSTPTS